MSRPWPRPQTLILTVLTVALAVLPACRRSQSPAARRPDRPANRGVRTAVPFETIRASFAEPDMTYAPFIFWFWDEPLDPAKMAEMSRTMLSQRFSPGYAHARRSMVGTPDLPDSEWLGDAWFASFDAALKEAEARQSYLGYCDEYWWPSFQANGRILKANPDLQAASLSWATVEVPGGAEATIPASFFAAAAELDPASGLILSKTLRTIGAGAAFAWKAPAGSGPWRVYVFNTYSHAGADGSKVNYLDARLAPAFIDIALEPYARRLSDRLGRSIPGDFIDNEGDYGWGLAWSGTLDQRYRERYGRDIRLWLPLSVDRDAEGVFARARWEWFDLVSDIYAEGFQAVTDWHEKRGMYTTIHFWEEGIQPQVSAVGDHLKLLRSVTMPGQDCLGRKALRVHDFKEIESVAEFEDRAGRDRADGGRRVRRDALGHVQSALPEAGRQRRDRLGHEPRHPPRRLHHPQAHRQPLAPRLVLREPDVPVPPPLDRFRPAGQLCQFAGPRRARRPALQSNRVRLDAGRRRPSRRRYVELFRRRTRPAVASTRSTRSTPGPSTT